jgi:hypothetical protein
MNKDMVAEQDLKNLLVLESTQAIFRKYNFSDSLLISAFIKAKNGNKLTNDEKGLQYEEILDQLDLIQDFTKDLKTKESFYEDELNKALLPYISPDQQINVEIVGVLGGTSTGYTFGDWDKFYISLHHMKGDPDYLFSIFKHELFHNLQSFRFKGQPITDKLRGAEGDEYNKLFTSYILIQALYNEGTATYLDRWLEKDRTEANAGFIERALKSKRNEEYIFYMFDKLISALPENNTGKDLNSIYNIFFTTRFDEAGYHIGSVITEYLLEQSEHELTYYMDRSPVFFIADYIKYSDEDDKTPYHFSDEFKQVVMELDTVISK